MSALEEEIIERVHSLPPDRQKEVLRFVESLTPPPRKSLVEQITELYHDIPDSEWEKLPSDASENLDHYLYGAPRK